MARMILHPKPQLSKSPVTLSAFLQESPPFTLPPPSPPRHIPAGCFPLFFPLHFPHRPFRRLPASIDKLVHVHPFPVVVPFGCAPGVGQIVGPRVEPVNVARQTAFVHPEPAFGAWRGVRPRHNAPVPPSCRRHFFTSQCPPLSGFSII